MTNSEEEFELYSDIEQLDPSENGEENIEEAVAYFTAHLAVSANNIHYSTVSVEYPPTSSRKDKGTSGIATIYNVLDIEDYDDSKQVQKQVQAELKKKAHAVFRDIQYSLGVGGVTICHHLDDQIKSAKHCSVDFDSSIFKAIKNGLLTRSIHTNTLGFYLAIIKNTCPKTLSDGSSCVGLSVLRKIKESTLIRYRTNENTNRTSQILQCKDSYFIGCSLWANGDTWHRFVPVSESCDVNLIRRLLAGEALDRSLIQDRCCTVLSNTTQKKVCSFPHLDENNQPYEASLENIPCQVKFYRFTPLDLVKCPFIILVCIGEHTHPPPPPSHIPEAIRDRLKTLIEKVSTNLEHVTPRRLISEIHASLNNLDHLRYLVARVQNSIHPHGQGILGLVHAFSSNLDNIHEYVQRIAITYARVFTNIATANAYQRMFKATIETVEELCNQKVQIKHIHNTGWRVILGDLDAAQAKGLGLALADLDQKTTWETHLTYIFKNIAESQLSNYLKNLKYELLMANKERVTAIFLEFFESSEVGASDWASYYSKPWRLASLNHHYSNIDKDDWCNVGETTNVPESAHADANREGTQMSLWLAIQ
ncbi:12422_t:CDS:10, partial [Ambispora gerdemannii]